MKMEENESVAEFSARISNIANEAQLLGKKYKEKKLVKKLLRSLPEKYTAYKTALSVSSNTDETKYSEVVGMLKAYEMESAGVVKEKSIALVAEKDSQKLEELQNSLGLLAKRFNRAFKRDDSGTRKFDSTKRSSDAGKSTSRSNSQCHECKGTGHFRSECPTLKRKEIKCYECNGFGHTQQECIGDQKKIKDRSMLGVEEDESDETDDEVLNNFVAFAGITEEPEDDDFMGDGQDESDSDADINVEEEYQKMCRQVLEVSRLNSRQSDQISHLEAELEVERAKNLKLNADLMEQNKKIKMLVGTKGLDYILNQQRYGKSNFGLGYTGVSNTPEIKFVKGGMHHVEAEQLQATRTTSQEATQQGNILDDEELNLGSCFVCGSFAHFQAVCPKYQVVKNKVPHQIPHQKPHQKKKGSCFVCGSLEHFKAKCPEYRARIAKLTQQNKVHYDGRNRGWVKKTHLHDVQTKSQGASRRTTRRRFGRSGACQRRSHYIRYEDPYYSRTYPTPRYGSHSWYDIPTEYPRRFWDEEYVRPRGGHYNRGYNRKYDEWCNMACQGDLVEEEETWYFDSGCSKHMTGKLEHLQEVRGVKGGKVSFGGGTTGQIKGKGKTSKDQQPKMMNVYFVDGLKSNLISVSQLCDQGLKVVFTDVDCEAIDKDGNVKMRGVRSDNNCYMWRNPTKNHTKCLGGPKHQDAGCDSCMEEKQIKFHHKKVESLGDCRRSEGNHWIEVLKEESEQGIKNEIWVPCHENRKRNFKSNCDVDGVVVRNKAHPVAQGYSQVEESKVDETCAPEARSMSISPFMQNIFVSWPLQQSRTQHIDIRHHVIRKLVEDKKVMIEHGASESQLAKLFFKSLDLSRFISLYKGLGICDY